jgi:outer membrane protein OmpA-like peptidoglycan-associated protein
LSDRITQLERELKIPLTEAAFDVRLERLQQVSQQQNTIPTLTSHSLVKITLPSNLLFRPNQNLTLTPEGETILAEIAEELKQFSEQTIAITAHLDANDQIIHNRELSYRQAKAIQQFLQPKLPQSLRWSVVGYGQTRLLTREQQTLNRRIEIIVIPHN